MKRAFAAAFAATLSIAASAQSSPREACRQDVQSFCASAVKGGAEQVKECLIDHQKEVSDACYDALKSMLGDKPSGSSQSLPPGAQACKADVPKFCKGVKPGGGRIKDCLIDHQKDISDACYDFLSKQKAGDVGLDMESGQIAVAPPAPVYRQRQADGSTLYSNVLQSNATMVKQVQITGGNSAMPPR